MENNNILIRAIFEILGSPKDHVEATMNLVLDKVKEIEGVEIKSSETYEAKEVEGKLWSTFSEVEFEVKDIELLMNICFNFMPSSIEIIEPGKLIEDAHKMSNFFNDLLGRLHKYDMLVKNLNAQNLIMQKELKDKKE